MIDSLFLKLSTGHRATEGDENQNPEEFPTSLALLPQESSCK
jgi:hypothetical protein